MSSVSLDLQLAFNLGRMIEAAESSIAVVSLLLSPVCHSERQRGIPQAEVEGIPRIRLE